MPLGAEGRQWIPLDPGLAGRPRHLRQPGALGDPLGELGLTAAGLWQGYLGTVQAALPLDTLRTSISTQLARQGRPLTYDTLLDSERQNPETFGALPSSLPYPVEQVTGEYDFLPSPLVPTFEILAQQDARVLLKATLPVYAAAGHRLVVAYAPAGPEDEEAVARFGGQLSTPPYLANLVAVVRVDGKEVARGTEALGLGQSHSLRFTLRGSGAVRVIQNRGIAGNIYAVALGAPRSRYVPATGDAEGGAGVLLHTIAQRYVNDWSDAEEELARLLGVGLVRPLPNEVVVSNQMAVESDLGVVTSLEWRGVQLDADLRAAAVLSARAGASPTAVDDLRLLSGLHGSALERQVLEDALGVEAISAEKTLAAARDAGIEWLTLDATNLATELGKLTADAAVVADVQERVAAGQVVTIQARPVTRQDWVGTGYVARQPKTGESSYLLSGEVVTSGGLTIVRSSQWPDPETADALRHPDSPKTVDVADVSPGTTGELELYDPAWQTILVGAVAPAGLRARIRLASGSAVKGAHVVFTTENGQTRCFKTRAEADQFSKDLDALTSSAAVRARVMASPASLDVVTSEPLALAEAFCVAGPLLGDSYIVTPDPTWESPRALGFGEVRTRWVRQKGVDVVARQPFQLLANPRETTMVELGPSSLPAVPTGMPAPFALIARLRDRFGNPEAKATVDWTSTQVGGQFRAAGGTTSRTATGIDGTTSVGYIVGGQPGAVTITARTVNALSKELRATVGFGALDAGASDCVLTVAYDPPDIGLQGVVGTAMPFTIAATPIGRSAIGGGTFTATLTAADGKTLDVASGESGSAVRLSYLMQPDTFALIRTSMGDCVAPPPRRVYAAGVTLATERILVDGTVLPLEPRPFCAGTLDPLAPVSEECFECIMTGCNGRPEYLSRHWTGIDCIGLVYASEQYAVHAAVVGGAAAEVLEGLINPPLSDMSAEFTTLNERNSVGGFYVPDHSFPAASVAASGAVYFVHAAPSAIKDHTGVVRRGMAAFARRGDLMVTAKHIQIAYSDGVLTIPPSEAGGKPWSIEAAGPQDQTYGRKKQLFGRKALVRPLDDEAYQPAIVVREILWH